VARVRVPSFVSGKIFTAPALLAFLVVLFHSQLTWKDSHYPLDDAGAYAQVAQEVYLVAKDFGWREGLWFGFFHRHWKPIIGQNLLTPFYFLSGGDTRLAFKIYSLVFSTIFTFSLFFAFHRRLKDVAASILGTLLLLCTSSMDRKRTTGVCDQTWSALLVAVGGASRTHFRFR